MADWWDADGRRHRKQFATAPAAREHEHRETALAHAERASREMKLAAIIHKAISNDPLTVPAETVLEMATISGARALGLEHEIGSLEAGKKADFVVIDLHRLHTTPSPNPISTLVYAATGGEVEMVVVDGQIVVEQGELLSMDEIEIIEEAQKHANALYQRAGIEIKPKWPVL